MSDDTETRIRKVVREAYEAGYIGIAWVVQDEIEECEWPTDD